MLDHWEPSNDTAIERHVAVSAVAIYCVADAAIILINCIKSGSVDVNFNGVAMFNVIYVTNSSNNIRVNSFPDPDPDPDRIRIRRNVYSMCYLNLNKFVYSKN